MFYLVIDLEMCKVPRDYRSRSYKYANETIQIGAVLLDEEFKRIGTLSQYVHPEYGVIDHFIEKLTGIRNSQVKKAPKLQEALVHMIDWIGEREYKIYAWSESDRDQILHEMKAKKIDDIRINTFIDESRWIDYQDVFTKRFELERQISLEEALGRVDADILSAPLVISEGSYLVPEGPGLGVEVNEEALEEYRCSDRRLRFVF